MRMKKLLFGVILAAVVGTVIGTGTTQVAAYNEERRVEYYGRDENGNTY